MVYLFYATYISVDIAHHEIFRAKNSKGGINHVNLWSIWTGGHTCLFPLDGSFLHLYTTLTNFSTK